MLFRLPLALGTLLLSSGCAEAFHEATLTDPGPSCKREITEKIRLLSGASHIRLYTPPFRNSSRLYLTNKKESDLFGSSGDNAYETFRLLRSGDTCYLQRVGSDQKPLALRRCRCREAGR